MTNFSFSCKRFLLTYFMNVTQMKDRQIRDKMYKNSDDQSPFKAQVALSLKCYYNYVEDITLNA